MIVLVGGPIVLTIGTLLLGFPVALLLAWAPIQLRVIVAGFFSGALAAICVWLFGNWVFAHVAHEPWGSSNPSIAIGVALAIPFFNDLSHAQKVKEAASMLPAGVDEAEAQVTGRYAQLVGYVVGAAIAFGLLASRYAA